MHLKEFLSWKLWISGSVFWEINVIKINFSHCDHFERKFCWIFSQATVNISRLLCLFFIINSSLILFFIISFFFHSAGSLRYSRFYFVPFPAGFNHFSLRLNARTVYNSRVQVIWHAFWFYVSRKLKNLNLVHNSSWTYCYQFFSAY